MCVSACADTCVILCAHLWVMMPSVWLCRVCVSVYGRVHLHVRCDGVTVLEFVCDGRGHPCYCVGIYVSPWDCV